MRCLIIINTIIYFTYNYNYWNKFSETVGENHNGVEAEEAMDVEAGQFEDAEEDL